MIEVAVWLLVVGLCDLVRAARDATSVVRRGLIAGSGTALLVLAGLLLELTGGELLLVAGWVLAFGLWVLGSAAGLAGGGALARTIAFVGLGGGLVLGLLAGGVAEPLSRRLEGPLGAVDVELLALVVGVGLVQLATANVAVRLVLDAVGVPAATNEKKLKGGRLLGPMERLFVVGLGLAGQVTAAAIVVAAKGLLRFPELQRDEVNGPSDVTEYFLIGSFSSWLFALAGLGLVALA